MGLGKMDAATALKIGSKAMKVAEKVIKYVKTDNEATFGLDEEVSVVLFGEDIALIQGGGCGQPHFAQAGGKSVDGLSVAVDKVIELANL